MTFTFFLSIKQVAKINTMKVPFSLCYKAVCRSPYRGSSHGWAIFFCDTKFNRFSHFTYPFLFLEQNEQMCFPIIYKQISSRNVGLLFYHNQNNAHIKATFWIAWTPCNKLILIFTAEVRNVHLSYPESNQHCVICQQLQLVDQDIYNASPKVVNPSQQRHIHRITKVRKYL